MAAHITSSTPLCVPDKLEFSTDGSGTLNICDGSVMFNGARVCRIENGKGSVTVKDGTLSVKGRLGHVWIRTEAFLLFFYGLSLGTLLGLVLSASVQPRI